MIAVGLRHLEYFVAVAAELNSSRAAERIHVVQSALSASVGKLEKDLDVELFDRSKRQRTRTVNWTLPIASAAAQDANPTINALVDRKSVV